MKKYKTKAQISQAGWGIDFAHRYSFRKSKYSPKRIRLHEFQYYRKIENFARDKSTQSLFSVRGK